MVSEKRNSVIDAVKWTTIEQVSTLVLQFIIGIIVARLVDPSDYGIIAMLGIFISFGNIFINSGFSTALIRKKDVNEIDYSTAFYFNLIVGLVVYILLYISAPLIADFYNIPLLAEVTRLYCLSLPLGALSIVQIAKLTHEIQFKIQFVINSIALLVSGSLGVFLAYKGYGVWALAWQGVCFSGIKSILYWIFAKWKPLLAFSEKSFSYLFSFGSRLLATNILDILYDNIYTLVIGKYYSAKEAGYYNRSLQISQLPKGVLSQVVSKVALPILAQYQDNDQKLVLVYEKMFRATVFVAYPMMMLLVSLAHPIIFIILGEKWLPAVPYMQILSFSIIFVTLTLVNLNLFFVKGRADLTLKIDIWKKMVGFLIVAIMTPLGLKWICAGTIIYAFSSFVINCAQTKRILNYGFIPQVKSALPAFFYSILMGALVYITSMFFENQFFRLVIGVFVGVISYLFIAWLFNDETLREIVLKIKSKYGKR